MGDPLLGAVAVLAGNDTLISDDVDVELAALLETSPDLLELVLDHEGKGLVKLHLAFLLDGVAGDLAALEDRLVGALGLDIEEGTDTVADGSDSSLLLLPDCLDNTVDLFVVGKIEEGSGTTRETDTVELLRADLIKTTCLLHHLHGLVVLHEAPHNLVMLTALQAVRVKVALTTAGRSKGDLVLRSGKLVMLRAGHALPQVSNFLDVETGAMSLLLSHAKGFGVAAAALGELAGVGEDDEDLVHLVGFHIQFWLLVES